MRALVYQEVDLDLKGFWTKCLVFGVGGFILTTLVTAGGMALFHAENLNQVRLTEMSQKSQVTQKLLEDEIRYLVSDLIDLQAGTQSSRDFAIYGVLNKKTQKITSVYPQKISAKILKKLDVFTPSSFQDLKTRPVAFQSIKLGRSNIRQIVLLVDPKQVKDPKLSASVVDSGVLFGVISYKKVKKLGGLMVSGGFSEAFVFDAQKGWWPLHSKVDYAGYKTPKKSLVYGWVKKSQEGWLDQKQDILTTGTPLNFINGYLVLNQKSAVWTDYLGSSIKKILPFIFGISMLLSLFFIFFIQPMATAYEHLSLIFRNYALSKTFPVPQSKKNIYVKQTLPWIKKIYNNLREHQMVEAIDQDNQIEFFSQMIQKLSREIEDQYPDISFKCRFIEEAHLFRGDNKESATQTLWLKQAFSELVKNSLQRVDEKGTIHISTYRKNGIFCCSIRNYNKGNIDQACQSYDSAQKDVNELGVNLALLTVSQIGGDIQFLNKPDGLEIEVSLPLKKVKRAPQARLQI